MEARGKAVVWLSRQASGVKTRLNDCVSTPVENRVREMWELLSGVAWAVRTAGCFHDEADAGG